MMNLSEDIRMMEALQAPKPKTVQISLNSPSSTTVSNFDVNLLTNQNFITQTDRKLEPQTPSQSKSYHQSIPPSHSSSQDSGISDNLRNDNMELDEISLDNSEFKFPRILSTTQTTIDNFYPKSKSFSKSKSSVFEGSLFRKKINIQSNIIVSKKCLERPTSTSLFSSESVKENLSGFNTDSVNVTGSQSLEEMETIVIEDECESSKSTVIDLTEDREERISHIDDEIAEHQFDSQEIISQTENFDYNVCDILANNRSKSLLVSKKVENDENNNIAESLSDADTIEMTENENLGNVEGDDHRISESEMCVSQSDVKRGDSDEITVTEILRNLENFQNLPRNDEKVTKDDQLNYKLSEISSTTNNNLEKIEYSAEGDSTKLTYNDGNSLTITRINRKRKTDCDILTADEKIPKLFEDSDIDLENLTISNKKEKIDDTNIENTQNSLFETQTVDEMDFPTKPFNQFNTETIQNSLFLPETDDKMDFSTKPFNENNNEFIEKSLQLPILTHDNKENDKEDKNEILEVEDNGKKLLNLEDKLKDLESEGNFKENISEAIDELFEIIKDIKKDLLKNANEVISRKCEKEETSRLVVEKPPNPFFYDGNQPLNLNVQQQDNNFVVEEFLNNSVIYNFDDDDDDVGPHDVVHWENLAR